LTARILCLLVTAAAARADDWPQWRGPNRDGTSEEKGLLQAWPADGPKLLWRTVSLGAGYAGPAVVGDRVFVMGSDGTDEYLAALRVADGRELWRLRLGPEFKNGWGHGPRGTPTVVGDTLVALGAQGVLLCASTDGKERWRTNLRKNLHGELMKGNIFDVDWGYSESPLVDENRVTVTPGGPKGTIAAFELPTGKLLWRTAAVTDAAGYASVVAAEFHGTRQYVQLTGGVETATVGRKKSDPRAVGLDPKTGATLWQHDIHYTMAGVINTPVVWKNFVYASCPFGGGCTILRIDKTATGWNAVDTTCREVQGALNVYHGGVVPFGDRVLGYSYTHGWVYQALPSGESLWEDKRKIDDGGSHVRIADRVIVVTTKGTVILTEPSDKGWKVAGSFTLPDKSPIREENSKIKVCTHPVVSNGRLYIRDQERLYCYDLREKR
jgi:hypothetical protein